MDALRVMLGVIFVVVQPCCKQLSAHVKCAQRLPFVRSIGSPQTPKLALLLIGVVATFLIIQGSAYNPPSKAISASAPDAITWLPPYNHSQQRRPSGVDSASAHAPPVTTVRYLSEIEIQPSPDPDIGDLGGEDTEGDVGVIQPSPDPGGGAAGDAGGDILDDDGGNGGGDGGDTQASPDPDIGDADGDGAEADILSAMITFPPPPTPVLSSSSSPPPPPPLPQLVEAKVEAAGSVSDYTDEVKLAMRNKIADSLSVDPSATSITVTALSSSTRRRLQSGSRVSIGISILYADSTAATTGVVTLTTQMTDTNAASALLSTAIFMITVTAIDVAPVQDGESLPPPPSPPPPNFPPAIPEDQPQAPPPPPAEPPLPLAVGSDALMGSESGAMGSLVSSSVQLALLITLGVAGLLLVGYGVSRHHAALIRYSSGAPGRIEVKRTKTRQQSKGGPGTPDEVDSKEHQYPMVAGIVQEAHPVGDPLTFFHRLPKEAYAVGAVDGDVASTKGAGSTAIVEPFTESNHVKPKTDIEQEGGGEYADHKEGTVLESRDGWESVVSDEGDLYYFNADTGESTWERPEALEV